MTHTELPTFWFEPGPAASAAEIDEAERYIGRALPGELRQLLLTRNGGVSIYSGFVDGDRSFPVLPFFGVDPALASGSLMPAFDVRVHFEVPDGVIPFAGQGQSWLGLDFRNGQASPSVVYKHENGIDLETVSPTFSEFLARLVEE